MVTLQQIKNLKQYDKIYALDDRGYVQEIHFMGIAPINSIDQQKSVYVILYHQSKNQAYTLYININEPSRAYFLDEKEALRAGIEKAENHLKHEQEAFKRLEGYNTERLAKNGTRSE